jgi:hypothetical protein
MDINSLYHFERIPGNIPGAYVNLESELIRCIKYHVNPETDKIKIKISGDGSKVSRISNFVNCFTFSNSYDYQKQFASSLSIFYLITKL